MQSKLTLRWAPTFIVLIFAASLIACGGQKLTSTWRDREVIIDGVNAEWEGAMAFIDKKNVAMGLLNDEEYIHICLATVDFDAMQQMLGSGLTLWFDPQGGKKKTFGINFPLGMQFSQENMDRESMPSPMSRDEGPDPEKMWKRVEESEKEMVIIGPQEGRRYRMPIVGSQEIQVGLAYSQGKLVYELRVPLVRDAEHPDAIGLEDSEFVGIGFETTALDMEKMRDRMGGGMSGGGPGGRGSGGMPGGGMPGRRRPNGGMPGRFELWTKVELASAESGASMSTVP